MRKPLQGRRVHSQVAVPRQLHHDQEQEYAQQHGNGNRHHGGPARGSRRLSVPAGGDGDPVLDCLGAYHDWPPGTARTRNFHGMTIDSICTARFIFDSPMVRSSKWIGTSIAPTPRRNARYFISTWKL